MRGIYDNIAPEAAQDFAKAILDQVIQVTEEANTKYPFQNSVSKKVGDYRATQERDYNRTRKYSKLISKWLWSNCLSNLRRNSMDLAYWSP
jgi:hypothetical protein